MGWRLLDGRVGTLLTTLAGLVLCAFDVHTQFAEATRIPQARPDQIATKHDAVDRMTVQVQVNGQGPYPFVIDTGADRTVVSSELATELKLAAGDPVLLHDVAGMGVTPTARIDDLKVGSRDLHEVDAPTLLAGNIGAKGLLGVDSLSGQRMVMDFRRNLMSVEPSRRWGDGGDVIVVRAKSRYGQLILVDASIGHRPLAVIIDSGAQYSIGNLALQREVVGPAASALGPSTQVIGVTGRTAPATFAVLSSVRLGDVDFKNLPIAFADLHTFQKFGMNDGPAMLLGMDVLKQFDRVVVDFGRRRVSFTMRAGDESASDRPITPAEPAPALGRRPGRRG